MASFFRGIMLILLLALGAPGAALAQACVAGSSWVLPISIDNSSNANAFTDLEVLITVDTATLIGAGHMNPDGSDIRFTDGINCIPHTVDSGMNTAATQIWVRVPSLPASGNATIRMYYGNAMAASVDDPSSTFTLFEGFEDEDGLAFSNACGSPFIYAAGGIGTISWTTSGIYTSNVTFPVANVYVAEAAVVGTTGTWPAIYWFKDADPHKSYALMVNTTQARISVAGAGSGFCTGHNWASALYNYSSTAGVWRIAWHGTGDIRAEFPTVGAITSTDTTYVRDADLRLGLGGISSGTGSMSIDWVRARQFADPMPVGVPGTAVVTEADLSISIDDSAMVAIPGENTVYTIVASNSGPDPSLATVAVDFPAACASVAWTCTAAGGGSCGASGSGDIADSAVLPVSATATYTATCSIDAAATGTLTSAAMIFREGGDPVGSNNDDGDSDTLTPVVSLSVTKSDGRATLLPTDNTVYAIDTRNTGPSDASSAQIIDLPGPAFSNISWMCVPAQSTASCPIPDTGTGGMNLFVDLAAGTMLHFELMADTSAAVDDIVSNTVSIVSINETENDTNDNTASDDNLVISLEIFADGFEQTP